MQYPSTMPKRFSKKEENKVIHDIARVNLDLVCKLRQWIGSSYTRLLLSTHAQNSRFEVYLDLCIYLDNSNYQYDIH